MKRVDAMEQCNLPLVSIIIPMRNEASYIDGCLASVLDSDYPQDKLEILVVDGMSEDGSRKAVEVWQERYPSLRLLDNPKKVTPVAMNLGIKEAKGEIIIVFGAHSQLTPDFIRRSVDQLLNNSKADCVGGILRCRGEGWVGNAIVLALSSPFGVGNARFRIGGPDGWVDTVAFGAYRREIFKDIGLFDEAFLRNQDDEFNYRLVKSGGKIYLDSKIQSLYYVRPSLRKLWEQYFQYGYWKIRVIQKHKLPASWRHVVPALFLLSLSGSTFLWLLTKSGIYLFVVILGFYVAASLLFSILAVIKGGWRSFPLLPFVFAIVHFSYGLGFLKGLWDWVLMRRHLRYNLDDVELTR